MNHLTATRINGQAGFSLVEIMVVIALIALVGTFAITQVTNRLASAKVSGTKVIMNQLGASLDQFRIDCNQYPTTDQGLAALVDGGGGCKNFTPGGYLKNAKVPNDAWDRPFTYESDGSSYTIISLGEDGKEGGEGFAKDLSSKELD